MEFYNSTVLGGGSVGVAGSGQGGAIQPDSAYKSLGSVYNGLSTGGDKGKKMTYTSVKSARSVQNMAERSYSVSEVNRAALSSGGLHRTPHRAAGYGGAGQPTRGPHRYEEVQSLDLYEADDVISFQIRSP